MCVLRPKSLAGPKKDQNGPIRTKRTNWDQQTREVEIVCFENKSEVKIDYVGLSFLIIDKVLE